MAEKILDKTMLYEEDKVMSFLSRDDWVEKAKKQNDKKSRFTHISKW